MGDSEYPPVDSGKWPSDYRRLRVGEIIQVGDVIPDCFGLYDPIREVMIGHRVLGRRDGEDIVYRKRKRCSPKKVKAETSHRHSWEHSPRTQNNDYDRRTCRICKRKEKRAWVSRGGWILTDIGYPSAN